MDLRKEFYYKLDYDRLMVNSNKNPIEMELFLSFLIVKVKRSTEHLGYCTGWTKLTNTDHKLEIGGGIVNGVEYLDSLRYKKGLHNQYNNWVTPFNMFELLTKKGQSFFFEYYKDNIKTICNDAKENIENLQIKVKEAKEVYKAINDEISFLKGEG